MALAQLTLVYFINKYNFLYDLYSRNIILVFFVFDAVIASISRGFILHKKAYLRNTWNILDFSVTVIQILDVFFNIPMNLFNTFYTEDKQTRIEHLQEFYVNTPQLEITQSTKVYHVIVGILRFVDSIRFFRIVNSVKNIYYLREFRLILRILLSLIPEIILILILLFIILSNATAVAMSFLTKTSRQICVSQLLINGDIYSERHAINYANHHPCSNLTDFFAFQCPPEYVCLDWNLYWSQNVHFTPTLLNFDNIGNTFISLLHLTSTEDYDPLYYRVIFQNGFSGFVFCAFICLFGFFVLSLILALIYDTYNQAIAKTPDVSNIHYFDGEMVFPFNLDKVTVYEYNLLESSYNNNQMDTFLCIAYQDKTINGNVQCEYEMSSVQSEYRIFPQLANELINLLNNTFVEKLICISILAQFCILLLYNEEMENNKESFFVCLLRSLETLIAINFTVEILVKSFAYQSDFLKTSDNAFDCFVLICTLLNELEKVGYPVDVLYLMKYFRFLRIFHLLMNDLTFIVTPIRKCAKIVVTTLFVFLVVFIYFSILAYFLFSTHHGSTNPDDMLDIELGFDHPDTAVRTVFMILFPTAWQETFSQLVTATDDIKSDSDPIFYQPTIIDLIPYGVYIFLFFGHLYHLMFADILIPQLFNELRIESVDKQSLNQNKEVETYKDYNKLRKITEKVLSMCPRTLVNGEERLKSLFKNIFWQTIILCLLVVDTCYNWLRHHFEEKSVTQPITAAFSTFILIIFVIDFFIRFLGYGIRHFFYSRKTKTYSWKCMVAFIDTITITASAIDLWMTFIGGFDYYGRHYVDIFVNLSCLRIIPRVLRLRLWFRNLVNNWRRIVYVTLFCIFIVVLFSIVGTQLFAGKMHFCEHTNARGYTNSTFRMSLRHSRVWQECRNRSQSIAASDQLEYSVQSVHVFNFDNIYYAFQTIIHIIYGDNIWETIAAVASISDHESGPQMWASWKVLGFVISIIFAGFILDTLMFAAISSYFGNESQPEDSIWKQLTDEKRTKTYLVLRLITKIKPWRIMNETDTSFMIIYISRVITNNLYDHFIFVLMVVNLFVVSFDMFQLKGIVHKIEYFFLVFYCLDSIFRVVVVGKAIFHYKTLLFLDVALPFVLVLIHAMELNLIVEPSLLITIRILAPDRYIKIGFLKRGSLILKALISSVLEQSTMFVAFIVFLLTFARIGIMLFGFTDTFGASYSPEVMPAVYTSQSAAFVHLFSVAVGTFFDVSITNLIIRSRYCRNSMSAITKQLSIDYLDGASEKVNFRGSFQTINDCKIDDCLSNETLRVFAEQVQPFLNAELRKFSLDYGLVEDVDKFEEEISQYISKTITESSSEMFCLQWSCNLWLFKAMKRKLAKFLSENKCINPHTIRIFYFIFLFVAKFILLNMLKSIVLEVYKQEKLRFDSGFTEDDITEFIKAFFEKSNNQEYLNVQQAISFVYVDAPKKFQIVGDSEEFVEFVLITYSLPVREIGFHVHAIDLMSICIAHNFNCDCTRNELKKMIENISSSVLCLFPNYTSFAKADTDFTVAHVLKRDYNKQLVIDYLVNKFLLSVKKNSTKN